MKREQRRTMRMSLRVTRRRNYWQMGISGKGLQSFAAAEGGSFTKHLPACH